MTSERRTVSRCPVCSGPSINDKDFPEGIRCRNSACIHNHSQVTCPRCAGSSIKHVSWQESVWKYTCSDCEHNWVSPEKS